MPRYTSASKPRSDDDYDHDFGPIPIPNIKAVLRSDFLRRLLYRIAVVSSLAACATGLAFVASAPLVNDLGLLKVGVYNHHTEPQAIVSFGFLGYCIQDVR
ncbi:MAG: hypothetical protein Q9199_008084 [Rusavskia elegans]